MPLLVTRPGGLLVEVTDGTKEYNDHTYRISVFYDLSKVAVNRLGYSLGHELEPFGAHRRRRHAGLAALGDDARQLGRHGGATGTTALDPGRSDGHPPLPRDSPYRRSPRYVGRGVAAMAADENRARWNQRSVTSAELAREYGFTDIDGHQPDGWAEL